MQVIPNKQTNKSRQQARFDLRPTDPWCTSLSLSTSILFPIVSYHTVSYNLPAYSNPHFLSFQNPPFFTPFFITAWSVVPLYPPTLLRELPSPHCHTKFGRKNSTVDFPCLSSEKLLTYFVVYWYLCSPMKLLDFIFLKPCTFKDYIIQIITFFFLITFCSPLTSWSFLPI